MTNILEYLEKTAKRLPEKAAFCDEQEQLTFSEVLDRSQRIGSYLASEGLSHQPVVVYMHKSPSMLTAFFGVIYAGCYYVPIDDEMPLHRIQLIFDTLKPGAVVCGEAEAAKLEAYQLDARVYLYSEAVSAAVNEEALARVRSAALDIDPIYIVYTSGSTGVPKGIIACHRSVIDYAETLTEVLRANETSVFGMQAPLYVDACLKEILSTIRCGATTWMIPKGHFSFPMKLVEYLNLRKINTVCWVVPALTLISSLGTFQKLVPEYLTTIAFGSEVFPIKQFRLWKEYVPNARYINLYGPTECTGMSCYYEVDRDFAPDEVIPIGKPFRNTQILLLNDKNELAAAGEPGEICIRGTSVTLGYYRNPEKTAECFVQNPLNDLYPEIIYRTGDLGRYNERGELCFISRKDYQIKHMGHRIELGEIEMAAAMTEGIETACCLFDQEKKKIILFYTGAADPAAASKALRARLPRYMMPSVTRQLERFPLTPNGKTDRLALKALYEAN